MFPLRLTTLQRRFLMVVTTLCVCWALGFRLWVEEHQPAVPPPRYQGTTGPYLVGPDGRIERETDTYHRGDRVGWLVAICYEPGTVGEAVTDIVDVKTGNPVSTMVTSLPISEVACSSANMVPRLIDRLIPMDMPPGDYELRRRLVLGESDNKAVIRVLHPFIAFKVIVP